LPFKNQSLKKQTKKSFSTENKASESENVKSETEGIKFQTFVSN